MNFWLSIFLTFSLFSPLAFARTEKATSPRQKPAPTIVDEADGSDADSSEAEDSPTSLDGMATVDELMTKKLDLSKKVESIHRIERAVGGASEDSPLAGPMNESHSYKPLVEEDPELKERGQTFRSENSH